MTRFNAIPLSLLIPVLLAASYGHAKAEDIRTLIDRRVESQADQSAPPAMVPYSYLVTVEHNSLEGDTATRFTAQYRVNPQAEPGNRLTFTGSGLADLPEEFQSEITKFDKEKPAEDIAEDFWCSGKSGAAITDQENFAPEGLDIVRENDQEAVIALDTLKIKEIMQSDDDDDMPKKLLKRLAAEVTVTKPDLAMTHMRIWLTKPTTIKLIAKLKEMEIRQSCAVAPNGFYYVVSNNSRVRAKALGKSMQADTIITISDLQPLDQP